MCSAKQRSCLVQLVVNVVKSWEIVFDSVIWLITAPKQLAKCHSYLDLTLAIPGHKMKIVNFASSVKRSKGFNFNLRADCYGSDLCFTLVVSHP